MSKCEDNFHILTRAPGPANNLTHYPTHRCCVLAELAAGPTHSPVCGIFCRRCLRQKPSLCRSRHLCEAAEQTDGATVHLSTSRVAFHSQLEARDHQEARLRCTSVSGALIDHSSSEARRNIRIMLNPLPPLSDCGQTGPAGAPEIVPEGPGYRC